MGFISTSTNLQQLNATPGYCVLRGKYCGEKGKGEKCGEQGRSVHQ